MERRASCYKISARAYSLTECWRIGGPNYLPHLLGAKFLGWQVPGTHIEPREVTEVPTPSEPESLVRAQGAVAAEAESCGFEPLFFYDSDSVSSSTGIAQAFLSRDRQILGLAIGTATAPAAGNLLEVGFVCQTFYGADQVLGTSSLRRRLDPPPWATGRSMPGAPVSELLSVHRQRLGALSSRTSALALRPEQVLARLRREIRRLFDYFVGRGLYVPCTEHPSLAT